MREFVEGAQGSDGISIVDFNVSLVDFADDLDFNIVTPSSVFRDILHVGFPDIFFLFNFEIPFDFC